MKLVLISDTHCQHSGLVMPEGDVLIHAGDWTGRGSEQHTVEFLRWIEAQKYPHKLFVAGNHDFFPEKEPVKFRELLALHAPTTIYLEDNSVTLNGYKFHGSPVSPWFCDWAFNRHRGAEIQAHWDMIPTDTEVLITHGPIWGLGDKLSAYGSEPGERVGCKDLRKTINDRLHSLKLHVSGHIHEGAGTYQFGNLVAVNASVLNEHYKMRNQPVVVILPDKLTISDPIEQ